MPYSLLRAAGRPKAFLMSWKKLQFQEYSFLQKTEDITGGESVLNKDEHSHHEKYESL